MIFSPATCKGRTTISFNLQYILSKFTKFVNKTYANEFQGYIKYIYLIKNYTIHNMVPFKSGYALDHFPIQ